MEQEFVTNSDTEGEVLIDGQAKTFALDFSDSDTNVRNTQTTTITQITNQGQGLAEFFKGGGAETLITAVVAIGGIGLVVWAVIKRKKKRKK